jgi:pimeloyl-ACP methyl ester carboxylesterase
MDNVENVFSQDGTPIAFEKSGSGPALVVVNGALSDRSSAATLRPLLDPHFTLFAYDRRGRGESEDNPTYAPERELEDLAAVIEATGGPAFVFGHSSGAILALRAALAGLSISGLAVNEPPYILHGTRPMPPADVTSRLQKLVAAGHREEALRIFFVEQVGLPAAAVESMSQSPTWLAMVALAHTTPYDSAIAAASELPRAALAGYATRTLVLRGGASFAWIAETARALAQALPNAELVTLEGQSHAPAANVLAPALIRFFLS